MDWKDIAGVVGKAAPLLGSILTGNVPGAIASAGVLLASAFGTENTPDAVHQAILTSPEAALKLAELESNNKLELQRLFVTAEANKLAAETAQFQAEVDDRKSARERQVQTGDRMPAILGVMAQVAFFGTLLALISGWAVFAKEYELVVGGMLGTLGANATQVFNYYFGSTKSAKESSREKDAMLKAVTGK